VGLYWVDLVSLKQSPIYSCMHVSKKRMMLRPGFEPGSRDRESSFSNLAVLDYSRHRNEFIEWISKNRLPKTWQRYVKFMDEMLRDKMITSPHELNEHLKEYERKSGKKVERHRKLAIRNYLNFLVETGKARKSQVIDYFPILKLEKTGIREADKAFTTEENIVKAQKYLKEKNDEARLLLFYLMLYGGVRLTEACDILNNFDKNELTAVNEKIARYDLLKLYKRINSTKAKAEQSKRAWIVYMPIWVAKKLKRMKVREDIYRGKHFCNGIILPNMLRKFFSNFLKDQGIDERIIEFMTGKTSEKVIRQFYFDLLTEADEIYTKIVDKFPIKEVDTK